MPALAPNDLVFATNGSMTADTAYGSNKAAPVLRTEKGGGAWKLWQKLAAKTLEFGHPAAFCSDIPKSKWESFTATARGPRPSLICWRPSRAARRARAVSSPSRTRTGFSPSS